MKTKLLIIFICVAFAAQVWAQTPIEDSDLTWTLEDGTLTISGTGDMPDYRGIGDMPWFPDFSSIQSVIIEDNVTSIGEWAFSSCSSLSSVSIGNSVTFIGDYAFSSCGSLTSVILPESVTTIGGSAFIDCNSLTSVTLPHSVTTIGGSAFSSCNSLISVTLPHSVTTIGGSAFGSCEALKEIIVEESNLFFSSSNGVLFNKDKTELIYFPTGKPETTYFIPSSVTRIGERAFRGCNSLISVIIPNSVTSIGERAFYYCFSLLSVTIGKSVTSIGDLAFSEFMSLNTVQVGWDTPLEISGMVFLSLRNKALYQFTLYVPVGTKSLYEVAPVWKDFGTIIESATGIETPQSADSHIYISGSTLSVDTPYAETVFVYSVNGELLCTFTKLAGKTTFDLNIFPKGVVIIKTSLGTKKLTR